MTQPYFDAMTPAQAKREKIRRRVRPTSVAQYADGRERFTGRKADVLRWLAHYYNRFQHWPTSAELAYWWWFEGSHGKPHLDSLILHVRRGLSDLQAAIGLVRAAKNGQRKCTVTERLCETWRVRSR